MTFPSLTNLTKYLSLPKAEVGKMFEGDETDVATAKSAFDLAARLGKLAMSDAACRKRFKACAHFTF